MGSTKVAAPPPRDVGKETRDNLQAQVDLAPELCSKRAKVSTTIRRPRASNDAQANGYRSKHGIIGCLREIHCSSSRKNEG